MTVSIKFYVRSKVSAYGTIITIISIVSVQSVICYLLGEVLHEVKGHTNPHPTILFSDAIIPT